MKNIYIPFFLLLLTFVSKGQGIISGNVQTKNSAETLVGAHIHIAETQYNDVTDEHGKFKINNVPAGDYKLQVTFIGYQTYTENIEVADKKTTSLSISMETGDIQLSDITITGSPFLSVNTLSALDIKLRPTNTSQDILRMVPGLFIAQHAGGGKAEQIFLRGFDIDHGTDLNLEVDGLPVNMVSHAHGQGYSDLHFIIPEVINYVDFNKGPYYADKGDFTTAGYVNFQTKNYLDKNFGKVEGGQFGTGRVVAGVNIGNPDRSKTTGYFASEFFRTNGYVENPQHFKRFNFVAKMTTKLSRHDQLTYSASYFESQWDASGQVPTRAVQQGIISRFGSIDNTEGGNTSRTNLSIKHVHEFASGGYLTQQAYAVNYDFNLFSNFTFFLHDPDYGDQIEQKESRMIYGYKANYIHATTLFGKAFTPEVGLGFRFDDVDNITLAHTVKRKFLNDVKRGDIDEANVFGYASGTLSLTPKLSVNAAFRLDYFRFTYYDKLAETDQSVGKATISPKLNFNYQVSDKTQVYVKSGYGFHSNDARVVTAQLGNEILPKALGVDIGLNTKITEKIFVNLALWRLDLEQEFVYVGDEGVVEPSGKTKREGIDLSLRYQVLPWLFFDTDVNSTLPKAKGLPSREAYIPLAPRFSSIGGLSFRMKNGINGSLRYRYLGDRPANQDYTVKAKGYFITDAILNYTRDAFEVGLSAENLFNVAWNEAQFDTESRLKNETDSESEIHFTPGTPLFAKVRLTIYF